MWCNKLAFNQNDDKNFKQILDKMHTLIIIFSYHPKFCVAFTVNYILSKINVSL